MSKIIHETVYSVCNVELNTYVMGKDEYRTEVTVTIHSPNRPHVDDVWAHLTRGTVKLVVTIEEEEDNVKKDTD